MPPRMTNNSNRQESAPATQPSGSGTPPANTHATPIVITPNTERNHPNTVDIVAAGSNYRNIKILRKNVSRWGLESPIPLPVWIMELELGLNLLEQEGNSGLALRAAVSGVLDGAVALSWAEVTQGSALRPARYPADQNWPPANVEQICSYFISLYVREDDVIRQKHLLESMSIMNGENYENFSQRVRMVGRYVKMLYKPWINRLPAFDVDAVIKYRLLWACGEPLGTRLRDNLRTMGINSLDAATETIIQMASRLTASEASAAVYWSKPSGTFNVAPHNNAPRTAADTLLGSAMNGLPGFWVTNDMPRPIPAPTPKMEPGPSKENMMEEVAKQVKDMMKNLTEDMSSLAGQLRVLGQKRSTTYAARPYERNYSRQAPKRQQIPQEILKRLTCYR